MSQKRHLHTMLTILLKTYLLHTLSENFIHTLTKINEIALTFRCFRSLPFHVPMFDSCSNGLVMMKLILETRLWLKNFRNLGIDEMCIQNIKHVFDKQKFQSEMQRSRWNKFEFDRTTQHERTKRNANTHTHTKASNTQKKAQNSECARHRERDTIK